MSFILLLWTTCHITIVVSKFLVLMCWLTRTWNLGWWRSICLPQWTPTALSISKLRETSLQISWLWLGLLLWLKGTSIAIISDMISRTTRNQIPKLYNWAWSRNLSWKKFRLKIVEKEIGDEFSQVHPSDINNFSRLIDISTVCWGRIFNRSSQGNIEA